MDYPYGAEAAYNHAKLLGITRRDLRSPPPRPVALDKLGSRLSRSQDRLRLRGVRRISVAATK
jgi:hypothetical protein